MGPVIRAHNLPPGMPDAKEVRDNKDMVNSAIRVLRKWDEILGALVIDQSRALDELNSDWTASQEVADVLMRKYKLPFRLGHHFASEVVDYARAHDIKPSDFPYDQAQRIYADTIGGYGNGVLPMSEEEFRSTLDPVAIVNNRRTVGGPQPAEMERMLTAAKAKLAQQDAWVKEKRARIDSSLAGLDRDFDKLLTER